MLQLGRQVYYYITFRSLLNLTIKKFVKRNLTRLRRTEFNPKIFLVEIVEGDVPPKTGAQQEILLTRFLLTDFQSLSLRS